MQKPKRQNAWRYKMNKASERQARYDSKATTRIGLKLNNKTDADILEWLDQQESKQGAIKRAIRKMMEG